MADVVEELLRGVRAVVGDAPRIALHEPTLDGNAERYVAETVSSGWVSSVGAFVDRFETQLSKLTGASAIACVNGTTALHVALQLVGVAPGDEVLMPALTFVASANAVVHAGGVPAFADVDPASLALSAEVVEDALATKYRRDGHGRMISRESGRRLAAVMVVHVLGNPAPSAALRELTDDAGIPLVEDAAEALGSWQEDGRHCGTTGAVGVLSFNGNKIITTGGGGAVLAPDPVLAQRAKHLTTTAKVPHPWRFFHDAIGYNYRLPNLNAALGCAQMERLDDLLALKSRLASDYRDRLAGIDGISLIRPRSSTRANNWLTGVRFHDPAHLEQFLLRSHAEGILARPLWTPMHRLPAFAGHRSPPLPLTDDLASSVVTLPSSAHLAKGPAISTWDADGGDQ